MLRVTFDVDAPEYTAQAVKESLAMELERYADVRVVDVQALTPGAMEQTRLSAFAGAANGRGQGHR